MLHHPDPVPLPDMVCEAESGAIFHPVPLGLPNDSLCVGTWSCRMIDEGADIGAFDCSESALCWSAKPDAVDIVLSEDELWAIAAPLLADAATGSIEEVPPLPLWTCEFLARSSAGVASPTRSVSCCVPLDLDLFLD